MGRTIGLPSRLSLLLPNDVQLPQFQPTQVHCANHSSAGRVCNPSIDLDKRLRLLQTRGNQGEPSLLTSDRPTPSAGQPCPTEPPKPTEQLLTRRRRSQMLSRRIASASTRSAVSLGARPLPLVQRRTFFPRQMNSPKVINEKYPDYPKLTDAEDPGMVSSSPRNLHGTGSALNWGSSDG